MLFNHINVIDMCLLRSINLSPLLPFLLPRGVVGVSCPAVNGEALIAYKYRGISNWTKQIFYENKIFFPTASELNDPLDSSISISQGYKSAQEYLQVNDSTPYQQKCFLLYLLNSKTFGGGAEGRSIKLNDALQEYISSVGIFSLSKTSLEPLMWSHYGDSHKGICIGFDVEKLGVETVFRLDDVRYLSTPPYKQVFLDLVDEFGKIVRPWDNHKHTDEEADGFYTRQLGELMNSNWFVKSSKWAYEQEYRLISSQSGLCQFDSKSIVEVVMGTRISQDDTDWLYDLKQSPEYSHVKLKSVIQVDGSFDFMLKE